MLFKLYSCLKYTSSSGITGLCGLQYCTLVNRLIWKWIVIKVIDFIQCWCHYRKRRSDWLRPAKPESCDQDECRCEGTDILWPAVHQHERFKWCSWTIFRVCQHLHYWHPPKPHIQSERGQWDWGNNQSINLNTHTYLHSKLNNSLSLSKLSHQNSSLPYSILYRNNGKEIWLAVLVLVAWARDSAKAPSYHHTLLELQIKNI